jgi:hypothetical protein
VPCARECIWAALNAREDPSSWAFEHLGSLARGSTN